jgi:hypothetical protein
MLDPESLTTRVREHFATVSDEEFIANLRRYNPDLVRELGLQGASPAGEETRSEHDRSRGGSENFARVPSGVGDRAADR